MLVIVIAGVSCWPAFVALGAEVSSLSLRSQSQGIGWSFGSLMTCIFSVALPYIYNLDAGDLRGKTAFVYAGLCALCLVISFLFVPEVSCSNPVGKRVRLANIMVRPRTLPQPRLTSSSSVRPSSARRGQLRRFPCPGICLSCRQRMRLLRTRLGSRIRLPNASRCCCTESRPRLSTEMNVECWQRCRNRRNCSTSHVRAQIHRYIPGCPNNALIVWSISVWHNEG